MALGASQSAASSRRVTALSRQLIGQNSNVGGELRLCLACRNMGRAEAARAALLTSHPGARVDLLHLDVGSARSVLRAAREVKASNVINMFATAEGLLTQQDRVNADGLQEVFATNLFGHFLLVRELEPLLTEASRPSQVVWTSSSNALRSAFSLQDVQHAAGTEPYSSSKYASDLLSLALNRHLNAQGLYSSVICPGLVMTNMTYGILPSFLWTLLMPIMWLIRIFTNTLTLTPHNGAGALNWLFLQNPESLDPRAKYHSLTSGLGNNYTQPRQMDIDDETSEALYGKLLELEKEIRRQISEEPDP
ncbi:hypothetical protein CRUP_006575, partial [Coryphaenoides rupestris]